MSRFSTICFSKANIPLPDHHSCVKESMYLNSICISDGERLNNITPTQLHVIHNLYPEIHINTI